MAKTAWTARWKAGKCDRQRKQESCDACDDFSGFHLGYLLFFICMYDYYTSIWLKMEYSYLKSLLTNIF